MHRDAPDTPPQTALRETFYVIFNRKSGKFCQYSSRKRISQKHLRGNRGFTLTELMLVVAIIGIITAVFIPNLLDAMNKAKQKRSMMDMRHTGSAWLAWVTDQLGSASAGAQKTYDQSDFIVVDYATLHTQLRPSDTFFYMQEVPQFDAWQNDFRYARHTIVGRASGMLICSGGQDRTMVDCAEPQIPVEAFLSTDYSSDLIWADGYFLRWPVGLSP